MNFLSLAEKSRSCRRFIEDAPVTETDLKWLLECARLSPCGRNAQELRFITVANRDLSARLVALSRWATAIKDWNGPASGERAPAFIAVLIPEKSSDILYIDTGLVSQTINLAANSRNLATCIIMSFDHNEAARLLAPPAGYKIAVIIAVGMPAEQRVLESIPQNGSVAYWRDEKGIHHVPKRSLSELIVKSF